MIRRTIVQGEQAVAATPGVTLVTVLGSCIACCLYDPRNRAGGINHFLLGHPAGADLPGDGSDGRFGIHAMELLINAVLAHGGRRGELQAHLYGGATMVSALGQIGTRNIAFARQFLRDEGIALRHEDVGGTDARRVEFLPYEGRSRCRRAREVPVETQVVVPRRSGEVELFA